MCLPARQFPERGGASADQSTVLLAVIASEPRSGYGLKKMFTSSPASAYQPSPRVRCIRRFGGWRSAACCARSSRCPAGRRALRLYQVTNAGLAVYLEWLRRPVVPETVAADLGQHLMRFSLMENYLERAEVIAFLADLGDALDGFVTGVEQYAASGQGTLGQHALLALEHGIASSSGQPGVGSVGYGSARRDVGRCVSGAERGSNDEAGRGLAAVGGGGRGLGP